MPILPKRSARPARRATALEAHARRVRNLGEQAVQLRRQLLLLGALRAREVRQPLLLIHVER